MKKKTYIISVLVVLMLASAAYAFNAQIFDQDDENKAPGNIKLAKGQAVNLNFHADGFGINDAGQFKVTVVSLDGNGAPSDISVSGISTGDKFDPTGADQLSVPFSIQNENARPGNTYKVTLRVENTQKFSEATIEMGAASSDITAVPEFPTVAFPVAALVGLVYIISNKKKNS